MVGIFLEVDALCPAKAQATAASGLASALFAALVGSAYHAASTAVCVVILQAHAASIAEGHPCHAKLRTLAVDASLAALTCLATGTTVCIVSLEIDANPVA